MTKTLMTGFSLVTLMYTMVAIAGVVLFGEELETANANLMQNINCMY